jgi:hypothetical protein
LIALSAAVGLSAGAASAAPNFTIPVDREFWEGDATWDTGLGSRLNQVHHMTMAAIATAEAKFMASLS